MFKTYRADYSKVRRCSKTFWRSVGANFYSIKFPYGDHLNRKVLILDKFTLVENIYYILMF